MWIRTATMEDLDEIAAVEAACFPPAEAASKEQFRERLSAYGDYFWLLYQDGQLISFVDGMVTEEEDLVDEMFADTGYHTENGKWLMIFGVNTLPEYRRQGYAGMLIEQAIADAKAQGRKGVVLTCKEEKLSFYGKFGFVNEGISVSEHGGAAWYQMRITF